MRREHPLRRLLHPINLDDIETWQECAGNCGLGFKVKMSNGYGDTRTQVGHIDQFPNRFDHEGWRRVWLMINNQLEWYATELQVMTWLRNVQPRHIAEIADMRTYADFEMTWGYWGYAPMQNLDDYSWAVVQHLCKTLTAHTP